MKWFEVIEDLGDGSTATRRFKSKKSAQAWLDSKIEKGFGEYEEFGCYPLGDLEEVNTESAYFWDDL
jgi:hypothetical protein